MLNRDIIRDNPDKPWNWNIISYNEFSKGKEEFIRRNEFRRLFMGKGLDYNELSLFRELMEKVWSPENLSNFVHLE